MNPNVDPPSSPEEVELRRLLDEVRAGRILSEDALPQIERLRWIITERAAQPAAQPTAQKPISSPQRGAWIVGLVLGLVGGVFAAVGIGFGWYTWSFEFGTQRVEGVVVQFERSGKTSKPVVRYEVGGKEHRVVGRVGSNPSPYQVGEQIGVLYKIADPATAQIDSFTERWLFPLIFGGIGGVLSLVGWAILLYHLLAKLRPAQSVSIA